MSGSETTTRSRATKLLIVDDDQRNIFALKAVLKSRGFECVTAGSAPDGLLALDQHPDLKVILLDMMMPEMDGYETIRAIRGGPHKEKCIVAVTAQAMPGDREKCFEAGANAYISKPVDVDKLMVLLKEFQ